MIPLFFNHLPKNSLCFLPLVQLSDKSVIFIALKLKDPLKYFNIYRGNFMNQNINTTSNSSRINLNLNQKFSWDLFKYNFFIKTFTFTKIPLLFSARPKLIELSEQRTVLKIPLNRRNKNHLKVMYFGALCMGAEASVGIRAVFAIYKKKKRVDFLFKDFKVDFKKRVEGDVYFICDEGPALESLIDKCLVSGERETQTFRAYAVVPSIDPNEVVAEFQISLSVKHRPSKPK